MKVTADYYWCNNCRDLFWFDLEEGSSIPEGQPRECPICHQKMVYRWRLVRDTELAEQRRKESEEFKKNPQLMYEDMARKLAAYEASKPGIECPTCHSKNVERIGTGERFLSVAVFGLFSNKINKTFKCKNCGYTW